MIVLGIPMAKRKIKPNPYYGFKTQKTLSDENIWYIANEYAGKLLIKIGSLLAISSLIIYSVRECFNEPLILIILTFSVESIMLCLLVVLSFMYLKKL